MEASSMSRQVRVLLQPELDRESKQHTVTGCHLSFTMLGAEGTKAQAQPLPARLTFFQQYIVKVRDQSKLPLERVADLNGMLQLTGSPPRVSFELDTNQPLVEHQPAGTHVRHSLALVLGSQKDSEVPLMLRLFATEAQASLRYLELLVRLEIDGEIEASESLNDVLDLSLVADGTLRVVVVDPSGVPLGGTKVIAIQGDNFRREMTSDAEGVILIRGHNKVLPVEVLIERGAGLGVKGHIQGAATAEPEEEDELPPEAIAGCHIELGEAGPAAVAVSPDDTAVV